MDRDGAVRLGGMSGGGDLGARNRGTPVRQSGRTLRYDALFGICQETDLFNFYIVALHFGIMAVALTLPVNALIELVINSYMTGKTIRYHIGEILADAFPAFALSALMGAAVYGISLLSWHNLVLELFVQVIAGGICYIVLSWISHNPEFGMILRVIKSRKASQ